VQTLWQRHGNISGALSTGGQDDDLRFCQFRHDWFSLHVILGKKGRDAQLLGDGVIASTEAFGVTCGSDGITARSDGAGRG
jgi:hypothetical protein